MLNRRKIHIGRRTFKTVLSVLIAMTIVSFFGTTDSKLIFAVVGAMNAVQITFKQSVQSCMTQIVGVICGAIAGVLLGMTPLHPWICVAIGIICIIILYNVMQVNISPILPSMMMVTICTTPDIMILPFAMGRLWDTAIGLMVGMLVNILILPFDNSMKIKETIECLEKEVIAFLEEMFDGDDKLPDTQKMRQMIDDMGNQLGIYSDQWMPFIHEKAQKKLEIFMECEDKSRELLAQMEVLHHMKKPGRLDPEVYQNLVSNGAKIRAKSSITRFTEEDIITNYHVNQIMELRKELMNTIGQLGNKKKSK